ncbi:hypothetical protein MNBD_GAMMA06-533 [hydrothermal vent metagenome]|uniref:Uncharacterized protein n=1 Tax=hydrothermal vent metagenome TaxID=652676 RepID=A0A3B0WU64_9ZZZZ
MLFNKSGYYFIALLLLAFIGFWESYFSKLFADINGYVHFHAATMLLWICLLIAQAFLIRYKKYSLHKIFGKISYALVPAIILSLILLAHNQIVVHDFGLTYSRLYTLFLQLSLLAIFVIAYSLAILYRKSINHHARYMICTALTMIDPAVARIPLNLPSLPFDYQVLTFGLTDIILVALIFLERKQKTGRGVFPVMLSVFLFFQTLNLTWTASATWDNFALWFAKLPLT